MPSSKTECYDSMCSMPVHGKSEGASKRTPDDVNAPCKKPPVPCGAGGFHQVGRQGCCLSQVSGRPLRLTTP